MSFSPLSCPSCHGILPLELVNRTVPAACPSCRKNVQVTLFPAYFRKSKPVSMAVKTGDETSCFYDPDKPAAATCDICGVLISDLYDLQFKGGHYCPRCFSRRENWARIGRESSARTMYGGIALALSLLPLMAPAAIFVAVRYWNRPGSLMGFNRTASVSAIVLASIQLLLIVSLVFFYFVDLK